MFPASPALLDQVLYLERLATFYGVYSRRKYGGVGTVAFDPSWVVLRGFWVLFTFLLLSSLVSQIPSFWFHPFLRSPRHDAAYSSPYAQFREPGIPIVFSQCVRFLVSPTRVETFHIWFT